MAEICQLVVSHKSTENHNHSNESVTQTVRLQHEVAIVEVIGVENKTDTRALSVVRVRRISCSWRCPKYFGKRPHRRLVTPRGCKWIHPI